MSMTMSSLSTPQFVAEPLTVMAEPGQAEAGLHSAAAETHGTWRHSTLTVSLSVAGQGGTGHLAPLATVRDHMAAPRG